MLRVWRKPPAGLPYLRIAMVPGRYVGRDGSVGIETRYGLNDPGIEPRYGGEIFRSHPDQP